MVMSQPCTSDRNPCCKHMDTVSQIVFDYSQEQEAHVLEKQPGLLWTGLTFSMFFFTLINGHPGV